MTLPDMASQHAEQPGSFGGRKIDRFRCERVMDFPWNSGILKEVVILQ
jgi:hypothetical protein